MNFRFALCLAVLTACALGCGRDAPPQTEPPGPPPPVGPAAPPPPAAPRPSETSWGQAANGLQAGLSASQRILEESKPLEFVLHLRTTGDAELKPFGFTDFPEGRYCHNAALTFTARDSQTKWKLVLGVFNGPVGIETLPKGRDLTVTWLLEPAASWYLVDAQGKNIGKPKPGVYQAAAEYTCSGKEEGFGKDCWRGTVASGAVEIEIVGPGKGK